MSDTNLRIKFFGPALDGHEMDVRLLGPVLIAVGELCTEANQILNGENAKVKVLIKADVVANCVTIDLSLVQTIWQQVHSIVENPDLATAKELLEWVGLLKEGVTGAFVAGESLIGFLLWKKNRKETSKEIQIGKNGNVVIIRVEGDNNSITIPEQIYKLSQSPKAIESLKQLTSPVSPENGITGETFYHDKKEGVTIDEKTAGDLNEINVEYEPCQPETFTAHIVVYGVTFDSQSKHWKFKMDGRVYDFDISETTIAEQAMKRGGVSIGDTYRVKVERTEKKRKSGDYVSNHKVQQVLDFIPGNYRQQTDFPSTK